MSKHSDGPWVAGAHFAERYGARTYIPILRPGNDPVPLAVVHRDVDGYGRAEGEANARVFAAAWELLAALRPIVHPDNEAIVYFIPSDAFAQKLLSDARAAVAKAEGVTPSSTVRAT